MKYATLPEADYFRFAELREDWYRGADLMARRIATAREGHRVFVGFPRQWIPIFLLFGAKWRGCISPKPELPLVSDLKSAEITRLAKSAKARGQLRVLVEAWACLDPLLADTLYRIDRKATASQNCEEYVPLTGWQSYGRPEIVELTRAIKQCAAPRSSKALLLPCARQRPYSRSRTHKRIKKRLEEDGIDLSNLDKIVVSSIGVVPEHYWNHSAVIAYDSGVPDVWRVFRLMKEYFNAHHYDTVINCLDFRPYCDCVDILYREGVFQHVIDKPTRRRRPLPTP